MDWQFLVVVISLIVLIGMQSYQIADFAVRPSEEVDDYWMDCPKALDEHLREAGFVYSASYVADCELRQVLIGAELIDDSEDVNSSG